MWTWFKDTNALKCPSEQTVSVQQPIRILEGAAESQCLIKSWQTQAGRLWNTTEQGESECLSVWTSVWLSVWTPDFLSVSLQTILCWQETSGSGQKALQQLQVSNWAELFYWTTGRVLTLQATPCHISVWTGDAVIHTLMEFSETRDLTTNISCSAGFSMGSSIDWPNDHWLTYRSTYWTIYWSTCWLTYRFNYCCHIVLLWGVIGVQVGVKVKSMSPRVQFS